MQVVSSPEYLHVETVRHERLSQVVDLFRLLRLASSLRKDNICHKVEAAVFGRVAFDSNQARFLGVLKVEAVALGDLAVDCLLDPGDLIDKTVAELLEQAECKSVLGIDDPDEEVAVSLEPIERNLENFLIFESRVSDGHSSSWICRTQLPRRIAGNDVEHPASMFHLGTNQLVDLEHLLSCLVNGDIVDEVHDVDAKRDAEVLRDMRHVFQLGQSLVVLLGTDGRVEQGLLEEHVVFGVFFLEELDLESADVVVDVLEHALDS